MKALYVYPLTMPDDGFHVTDPSECREICERIDSGEFNAYYGWGYRWTEI